MAGSINEVNLLGLLGADPEVRRTQDGRPIVNLRVATEESWRDKTTGERKTKSEWHRVVIFQEGLCGIAEKYLRKGSKVMLRGQLQTRKWTDQQGQEKYSTEVVLQGFDAKLILLGEKGGGSQQGGQAAGGQQGGGYGGGSVNDTGHGKTAGPSGSGGGGYGSFDHDLNDEIPF